MRTTILSTVLSVAFASGLAGLSACSPYSPDLGGQPFLCDSVEPTCPDGYSCEMETTGEMRMLCVVAGGAIVDSGTSGFQCADDSTLEKPDKNDTIATAYQTPVASQRMDITFAGLAICPEGDKDNYAVNITAANQNLEVIVTWEAGLPISASILNSVGTPIANGTSNGPTSVKAYAANLPVGTYYTQAFAGATTKNNYKISIKVAGP